MRLAIRTGVNTGEVVAGDPSDRQSFATGAAVATTQRLEAAARSGEILLGDSTYRLVSNAVLVEPMEPLELKGKAEPVPAWRLLGVVEGAPPFPRRLDTPMVGREEELEALQTELDAADRERRCRLATIVGPAGIGKVPPRQRAVLRPPAAVRRRSSGAVSQYGEGITYWPLRGIVLSATGSLTQEGIAEFLEGVRGRRPDRQTGWPAPSAPRRRRPAARRRSGPSAGSSSTWRESGRSSSGSTSSSGPSRRSSTSSSTSSAGRPTRRFSSSASRGPSCSSTGRPGTRPARWCSRWNRFSDADSGAPRRSTRGDVDEERPRADPGRRGGKSAVRRADARPRSRGVARAAAIPPSIHALLAARLDRLAEEERAVLERAAVIGREFTAGAVSSLSEDEPVASTLLSLVRRDLIEPDRSLIPGDDGFRFRHILIRDAAYLGVAKASRAELHERYADWLAQSARRPWTRSSATTSSRHFVTARSSARRTTRSRPRPASDLPGAGRRAVGPRRSARGVTASSPGRQRSCPIRTSERREILPILGRRAHAHRRLRARRAASSTRRSNRLAPAATGAWSSERSSTVSSSARSPTPRSSVEEIVAVADAIIRSSRTSATTSASRRRGG